MSQSSKKVFSRQSRSKVPINEKVKLNIFSSLPLSVFRKFTNVRSLIVDKYKQQQNGKSPTKFHIIQKSREYHHKLSQVGDILESLEFIGSDSDENAAKIWLRSDREQNRLYSNATKHQKRFLYMPKNVLLKATNFNSLVHPDFIDVEFERIPNIDTWDQALLDLEFVENSNPDWSDTSDAEDQPPALSTANVPSTQRELRKRKIHECADEGLKPEQPTKRTRRASARHKSTEARNEESVDDDGRSMPANLQKASKIPLPNKKRVSQANATTEFQLKIQSLNVEDFVLKTNIKEIIQDEYRKKAKDINANISDEEYIKQVMEYSTKRMDKRKWNRGGLKLLKFIEDESEPSTSTHRQSMQHTVAPPLDEPDELIFVSVELPEVVEPNEFQREVVAMTYETFAAETNAKELVRKDLETETEQLTETATEGRLKELYEQRHDAKRYQDGLHKQLKLLKCQRRKEFFNKSTQTDVIGQDADVQCDMIDFGSNENSDCDEQSCQTKLDSLSIHEITESEIIQIGCISSSIEVRNDPTEKLADIDSATESQAAKEIAPNDSLIPDANATQPDPSGSVAETTDDIVNLVTDLEMVYGVQEFSDRDADQHSKSGLSAGNDDLMQPDSSADGMTMEGNIESQNTSNEIAGTCDMLSLLAADLIQSETEIIPENGLDIISAAQCDAPQNSDTVNPLEAIETDPTQENSDNGGDQLDSTQPAGISGEKESMEDSKAPSEPHVDAEKSMVSIEKSNIEEQNCSTSSDKVNSLRLSSFEPNEKSTPKSANESRVQATEHKDKGKPSATGQKRAQNLTDKFAAHIKFMKALRNNDPAAINAFLSTATHNTPLRR